MASFNYFDGIREDVGNMIDEIGTSCTIQVPTGVSDAMGNLVSRSYSSSTETVWCRTIGEHLDIEGIGQLDKEDLRFIAKYTTAIVPESIITFNSVDYFVLSIDKPDVTGSITHKVGYAKKVLT